MSRPLRIELKDGWYHVTTRGNNRQNIYLDTGDRKHFLDLLGDLNERFFLEVHGYVLMRNHYHLIVKNREETLSKAMHWLNASYSIWWNKRHNKSGHVMQGRYKSILVEGEGGWLLALSLYVHNNPIAIKNLGMSKKEKQLEGVGIKKPTKEMLIKRLDVLRRYKWSSYRAYAGYEKGEEWLRTDALLGRVKKGKDGYRRLSEERLGCAVKESLWDRVKWGYVLGSEEYGDRIRKKLDFGREHEGKRKVVRKRSLQEVIKGVESAKGEKWSAFKDRRGDCGKWMAYYLLRKYTGMSLKDIGEYAGGKDYASIAMGIHRFECRLRKEAKLRSLMDEAEQVIVKVKT